MNHIKSMPKLERVIEIEISKKWNVYGEHADAMRDPKGHLWRFLLSVKRVIDFEVRKQLRAQLSDMGVDDLRLRSLLPTEEEVEALAARPAQGKEGA